MPYSKKYNKKWYDKKKKDPEFRAKHMQQATEYRQRMKRKMYATAIAIIGDICNADMSVDEAVDKVMERYKIIERK